MQPGQAVPPPQSSEAPRFIAPAPSADASANGPQFLSKQENSDLLASNLIGQSVHDAQDEVIGDSNDLVTDENGRAKL